MICIDIKKTTIMAQEKIETTENKQLKFVFEKENYMLLIIAAVVIVIGFFLMSGGGTDDPTKFNEKELFSFRRITLAPIVVVLGYIIGLVAILKKPKTNNTNTEAK